jgi:hypothetical protein
LTACQTRYWVIVVPFKMKRHARRQDTPLPLSQIDSPEALSTALNADLS